MLPYVPTAPMNRRGEEIMMWVSQNVHRISGFVVVDDSEFSLGSTELDRRHFPRVDSNYGLREQDVDRMLAALAAGMDNNLIQSAGAKFTAARQCHSLAESGSDFSSDCD